nr:MAG TPA: hypothetical protein [Caudoviricetes sp.]
MDLLRRFNEGYHHSNIVVLVSTPKIQLWLQ